MPEPTVNEIRILGIVLPLFSLLVTTFRLYVRATRSKLWWDDAWAILAFICLIVLMVAISLFVKNPTQVPHQVKIAVYYMSDQFYYGVTWSARLSILFTIIRISFGAMRRALVILAAFFVVAWIILFSQVMWICEGDQSWKSLPIPQCPLGKDVAAAQVITDVITDSILIVAPLRFIWTVVLDRTLKIRLMTVFGSTSITTAVSMYHAYAVFAKGGLTESRAGTIQAAVSLLVANLTVVVGFLFRLRPSTSEADENTEPLHYSFARPKRGPNSTFGLISTVGDTEARGQSATIGPFNPVFGDSRTLTSQPGETESQPQDTYELKTVSHSNESTTSVRK